MFKSKKSKLLALLIINLLCIYLVFWAKKYFQPIAVIVPHHNLVADRRFNYLSSIKSSRLSTKKIFLVGPAHFSPDQSSIFYSNSDWNTSGGQLGFWKEIESSVKKISSQENNLVKNDHAVHNLIPDLAVLWPDAQMLPVLVGDKVDLKRLEALSSVIGEWCLSDCLLISSVDFSHYLPASLALVHDYFTFSVLNTMDQSQIFNVEVDSPQSLYLSLIYSKNLRARFHLSDYTNSGFISKIPDAETTTHFFASFSKVPKIKKTVSFETSVNAANSAFLVSQDTLGSRFFYGVNNLNLTQLDTSNLIFPQNTVIAKVVFPSGTLVTVNPYSLINGRVYFDRGQTRENKMVEIDKKLSSNPKFKPIDKPFGIYIFSDN